MEVGFPKAEEICKIILTCRRAGVSQFRLGALRVDFGARSAPVPAPQAAESGAAPTPAAEVPEQTIQAQQKAEEASHEEQEIDLRERQMEELLLTDPLKLEELMESGDLELPGENDGTEEREAFDQ